MAPEKKEKRSIFKVLGWLLNAFNLTMMVVCIMFSQEITDWLNEYELFLEEVEELYDYEHSLRILLRRWEGIALSLVFVGIFFVRIIASLFKNIIKKISK